MFQDVETYHVLIREAGHDRRYCEESQSAPHITLLTSKIYADASEAQAAAVDLNGVIPVEHDREELLRLLLDLKFDLPRDGAGAQHVSGVEYLDSSGRKHEGNIAEACRHLELLPGAR